MNNPFDAVIEIHKFLTKNKIHYMIIGGFAVQCWGEPRFTQDIDVTVLTPNDNTSEFIKLATSNFESRVSDSLNFALKNRMVLIKSSSGYEIDISLGIAGYEETAINRAIDYMVNKDISVKVCSAEDLIIHKLVAGRPRDLQDIESIIIKQGKSLDLQYLLDWLKQFAKILEEPLHKKFKETYNKLISQ